MTEQTETCAKIEQFLIELCGNCFGAGEYDIAADIVAILGDITRKRRGDYINARRIKLTIEMLDAVADDYRDNEHFAETYAIINEYDAHALAKML